MKSVKRVLFVALTASMAAFANPGAAAAQAYLDEYKAYMRAIEDKDAEAATAHAYAAWQAAEADLGGSKLTATLAYNYGQFVLFTDTAAARAALERADELRASGVADLPLLELDLYLSFAQLTESNNTRRSRQALRGALEKYVASGVPESEDTSRMWLALANAEMLDQKFKDAFETAQRAEKAIIEATPANRQRRADAMMTQGVSLIADPKVIAKDLLTANQILIRAARLFPEQTSIRTFDPKLAAILAWNQAAGSKFRTVANFQDDAAETYMGTHVKLAEPTESELADPEKFHAFDLNACIKRVVPKEGCGAGFTKRTPPRYPDYAIRKGYVGAAIVGYDLDATGSIVNAFVMAEAPAMTFGKYAVESMQQWEMAAPPPDHPGCLADFMTFFSFEITPG